MFGIDISNWQSGINLTREKFDFAIIKATEGRTYTDPTFESFAVQLTKLNKLIGCYHFARPDNQNTVSGIRKEAKHFCDTVEDAGLIGRAILVLDWEQEPTERTDLAEEWLKTVRSITGVIPFIYASTSVLIRPAFASIRANYPIWIANWTTQRNMTVKEFNSYIQTSNILQKITINWKIWQATDHGRWSGWNDNIDFNYTDMAVGKWLSYAQPSEGIYSSPVSEIETLSDDMKWAINAGLFQGYTDGKYHPKEFVTREQIASLLRRWTRLIEKR